MKVKKTEQESTVTVTPIFNIRLCQIKNGRYGLEIENEDDFHEIYLTQAELDEIARQISKFRSEP